MRDSKYLIDRRQRLVKAYNCTVEDAEALEQLYPSEEIEQMLNLAEGTAVKETLT